MELAALVREVKFSDAVEEPTEWLPFHPTQLWRWCDTLNNWRCRVCLRIHVKQFTGVTLATELLLLLLVSGSQQMCVAAVALRNSGTTTKFQVEPTSRRHRGKRLSVLVDAKFVSSVDHQETSWSSALLPVLVKPDARGMEGFCELTKEDKEGVGWLTASTPRIFTSMRVERYHLGQNDYEISPKTTPVRTICLNGIKNKFCK